MKTNSESCLEKLKFKFINNLQYQNQSMYYIVT